MDYFDFLNLFGFGRISQIYIIFLDIYVKQICGIWRRLFEFNISAFFIFAGADSDCCINSACSRSSMTVYVRMYIGVLMRMLNVHAWLQTTQPTSGGAVTVVSSCCANCVEPPRPQQWGPDLPFFGHAGHADPLDGWRCCSQKRVMSRPIQVRQL